MVILELKKYGHIQLRDRKSTWAIHIMISELKLSDKIVFYLEFYLMLIQCFLFNESTFFLTLTSKDKMANSLFFNHHKYRLKGLAVTERQMTWLSSSQKVVRKMKWVVENQSKDK